MAAFDERGTLLQSPVSPPSSTNSLVDEPLPHGPPSPRIPFRRAHTEPAIDPKEEGDDEFQPDMDGGFTKVPTKAPAPTKQPMLDLRANLASQTLDKLDNIQHSLGELGIGTAIERFRRTLADCYDLLDDSREDAFLSIVASVEASVRDLDPPDYTPELLQGLQQVFRLAYEEEDLASQYENAKKVLDQFEPTPLIDLRRMDLKWLDEEDQD